MSKILSVKGLNVEVENRSLISNLSFDIYSNSLTCVTGENGVGKTTLIKTLLKDYHQKDHVDFKIKRNQIKYIPQFRNIDDDYALSIKNFIGLGLQNKFLPWLSMKERRQIDAIIQSTDLSKIKKEPLGKASGGEQQRVYFAQALASQPRLLIMDETTASLDKYAKVDLLKLVKSIIKKNHLAVMFITHDPGLVQQFGDYNLHIADHRGTMNRIGGQD
ncbi:ABC transporter ATP-binding protein [Philodulcilactobacillus myokoensis]|uniref:ABC transporter ATP-binding protein n=1 Tax=Philodulcilactobacillus myokoensis TaxID=2929573 RepID=A0A9W6ERX6_9LACO|nr:ATP-binding cassette domain-containing protein [Philodulcilactobacillus myokoensis]GLB46057.1 ABC transporter ATP-binding protein [Philodulcilactobacillus myokoensis]